MRYMMNRHSEPLHGTLVAERGGREILVDLRGVRHPPEPEVGYTTAQIELDSAIAEDGTPIALTDSEYDQALEELA